MITDMTDEALLKKIAQLGKEMTSASSPRTNAIEKERVIYWKEAFKRNLCGYPPKKKYR